MNIMENEIHAMGRHWMRIRNKDNTVITFHSFFNHFFVYITIIMLLYFHHVCLINEWSVEKNLGGDEYSRDIGGCNAP